MIVRIPVSVGELFDKITILEVKARYIRDKDKLANIAKEHSMLVKIGYKIQLNFERKKWFKDLYKINLNLWEIENAKRECEKTQSFDFRFINLSRAVYLKNDDRAAIKAKINKLYKSTIVEEKSHPKYK